MTLIKRLQKLNACKVGVDYVGQKTAYDAWNNCERGDWMLWISKKQGIDLKTLTLAKVLCAKLVEHLMIDERSINALRVAERFANGEATIDELSDAAYAADAAAYAAAAAAADAAADAAAYAAADAADAAAYDADADADAAAADAADAAAYAADADADAAAAHKDILNKCADICREVINFDMLGL